MILTLYTFKFVLSVAILKMFVQYIFFEKIIISIYAISLVLKNHLHQKK